MLPKTLRLNLKVDFNWVRSGLKLESDLVRIFYKFGDNPALRLGVATPTRDFRLAVQRNRARRLVSKAIEDLYINLPQNLNLLIFPKSEILKVKSDQVLEDVKGVLGEIPPGGAD